MTSRFRAPLGLVLLALLAPQGSFSISAQVAQHSGANPPAVFTDPDRRAKLAKAFPEVDELVAAFMARAHVPGAAWGIVIDGELAHIGVAGFRELPARAPVTRDSVFRIASMTKSFTAMAILKLRDDGKLSLDDLAERHVPELKTLRYPTSDSPRIRIRDLMSHAAGFPEDNPWGDQQLAATEEEFTRMLRQGIPFSNPPGVAYEYANYGFAILGRIVTNVSGRPYRQYLAESILRPLGMTSTTLEPASVPADRLAHGYRWEDETWKEEPPLPDGAFGAMGGMLTSVADLSKYVGAFLAAWPPRDGPETGPIRRASLREMQQIWRSRPASVTRTAAGGVNLNSGGYGYGLRISQSCAFEHIVAHSGGLPGYGSLMQWLPDYGVGIVAFGNVTYTGWGAVVGNAFELLGKTGGLQPRMPQPSPSLVAARAAVSQLVIRWDDARADDVAAMNLFRDRSKDRRRKEIEDLRGKVGQCAAPASFDSVENWLRGQWTMKCERGDLRVSITLAPTIPPRVQHLEVGPAPPGGARPGASACRM
ncbi:MAG TPA: serine hydrolase domain-containing protein [Vicinamibacterales bacterium]|nr:serine hydrolase domain-containing protein [Vicinamibacterales bacterium]